MFIKDTTFNFEELRDEIELIIADYVSANNPVNISVASERIMRLCGIHAMQVASILGGYDEVVLGVRDAFINPAQADDTFDRKDWKDQMIQNQGLIDEET